MFTCDCLSIISTFDEMANKPLHPQADAFIVSLLDYFEREKNNGGPLIPLSAVNERCANALNISLRTIYRVKQRVSTPLEFHNKNSEKRKKVNDDLDETTKLEIRKAIQKMQNDKVHVNLKLINDTLKAENIADISLAALRRLLPDIGVRWERDHQKYYIEEKSVDELPVEVTLHYDSDLDIEIDSS